MFNSFTHSVTSGTFPLPINIIRHKTKHDCLLYLSVIWPLGWKWRDIKPSMVTHTRNSCSAFTHPSEHTHTPWTHTRSNGNAIYAAAPGEKLGVWCSRALHRGIEGGESTVHSLPPPTIPARPRLELRLSTIRPQLPLVLWHSKPRFLDLLPLVWRSGYARLGLL